MIRVYLDTSVISALFDRRNPERQLLTRLFFDRIESFDAYLSEVVLAEIDDTKDLRLRTQLIETAASFRQLEIDEETRALAGQYVEKGAVPPGYRTDSLHVALATVNGIDYLLSWNFQHLVRVTTRKIVSVVNASLGYPELGILTPAELV